MLVKPGTKYGLKPGRIRTWIEDDIQLAICRQTPAGPHIQIISHDKLVIGRK